jgi:hypothetical protein
MLHDYLLSLIRTAVPVAVGSALAWLAVHFNIALDEETSAQLGIAVAALAIGGYYALVRGLETRWPWFGKLLGASKPPAYPTSPVS